MKCPHTDKGRLAREGHPAVDHQGRADDWEVIEEEMQVNETHGPPHI